MPDDTLTIGVRGDKYEYVEIYIVERHKISDMVRRWENHVRKNHTDDDPRQLAGSMLECVLVLGNVDDRPEAERERVSKTMASCAVYILNSFNFYII